MAALTRARTRRTRKFSTKDGEEWVVELYDGTVAYKRIGHAFADADEGGKFHVYVRGTDLKLLKQQPSLMLRLRRQA